VVSWLLAGAARYAADALASGWMRLSRCGGAAHCSLVAVHAAEVRCSCMVDRYDVGSILCICFLKRAKSSEIALVLLAASGSACRAG